MGVAFAEVWYEGTVLGECALIFVTVGGMRAFDRLVREMDRVAAELNEQVVMQIGSTDYQPKNCDYFRFMPRSDMQKLYAEASVVVCHAGSGSILAALEHNKPLVVVPRLKKYGEVFDDHQVEIARQMEAQGAKVVYDMNDLQSAMSNAQPGLPAPGAAGNLAGRLKEYLDWLDRSLKQA